MMEDELLLRNDYQLGLSLRGRNDPLYRSSRNDRYTKTENSAMGHRSQSPKLINIQIDSNLEGQTVEGSTRINQYQEYRPEQMMEHELWVRPQFFNEFSNQFYAPSICNIVMNSEPLAAYLKEQESNKKMNRMKPNFETKLLFQTEIIQKRERNMRKLRKSSDQSPIDVEAEMKKARDEMR